MVKSSFKIQKDSSKHQKPHQLEEHKTVSSPIQNSVTAQLQNPDTKCGICENKMIDLCGNCQVRGERRQHPCTVSSGECGHEYHTHCMQNWMKMFKMCISCKKDWVRGVTLKRK